MPQKTKTFKNQQPNTNKSNNKKQKSSIKLDQPCPSKQTKQEQQKQRKTCPRGGNQRNKLNKQNVKNKKKYSKISNHTLKNAKRNMI